MDKALLELASESVFCSESSEIRYAESIDSNTKISLALATLVTVPFAILWWLAPPVYRGDLPKSLGLLIPVAGISTAFITVNSVTDSKSESFEAAYKIKCNHCMDDERCQTLYGHDWECVDGDCMEMIDEESEV